jgi:tripartite-type tricarboxylate transporter receptor subunit TctC
LFIARKGEKTMMKILRKLNVGVMSSFCATFALGSIAIFPPESFAQTYPTKPIRVVVAMAPGAGPDVIVRLLGPKLTEALGQPIIVDNRGGAGGRIAVEIVARAAPDGHTLLIVAGAQTICEAMYKDLKYLLSKDFSPITLLGTVPQLLAVNPSVPATSVKELVSLAKSRPGKLKYGSGGSGTNSHLSAELFKFITGTDILHVPYKGNAAAFTGAMIGEVDMTFQAMTGLMPTIKSGRLKALGVTTSKRTPMLPDTPSISESVPGYDWFGFYGLVAPAKTPSAILSKLNIEAGKALNTSAIGERMRDLGVDALGSSQKDFALFLSDHVKKMKEVVELSGVKPED